MTGTNGESTKIGTTVVKKGLAQMLKGGVIVSWGIHSFNRLIYYKVDWTLIGILAMFAEHNILTLNTCCILYRNRWML